jgi:hypothetical protein
LIGAKLRVVATARAAGERVQQIGEWYKRAPPYDRPHLRYLHAVSRDGESFARFDGIKYAGRAIAELTNAHIAHACSVAHRATLRDSKFIQIPWKDAGKA